MFQYFFGITIFLVSVFLVLLVLVQRGRGGGLAGALGGPGGQSAFGTKAGDLFTKITVGFAALWITLCAVSVLALRSRGVPLMNGSGSSSSASSGMDAGAGSPGLGGPSSGEADPGSTSSSDTDAPGGLSMPTELPGAAAEITDMPDLPDPSDAPLNLELPTDPSSTDPTQNDPSEADAAPSEETGSVETPETQEPNSVEPTTGNQEGGAGTEGSDGQ